MITQNPLSELPLGFGMALLQNPAALEHYNQLPPDRQRDILNQTASIASKAEMQALVTHLGTRD